MPEKLRGVYDKFYGIRRTDGRDIAGKKHYGCYYFVLDTRHDKHALAALEAYAESCGEEYPALAIDIKMKLDTMEWRCGRKAGGGA